MAIELFLLDYLRLRLFVFLITDPQFPSSRTTDLTKTEHKPYAPRVKDDERRILICSTWFNLKCWKTSTESSNNKRNILGKQSENIILNLYHNM